MDLDEDRGESEDLPRSSRTNGARGQASVKTLKMLFSFILSAGLLSAGLHCGADVPIPGYRSDFGIPENEERCTPELMTDSLQSVTITADRGVMVSRVDTLSLLNSSTTSDLLHQCPGLYVGDYGGPAGLKTVSLRGLGSAHTAIYVDGVRVGNVQSGQCDLGSLGIENFGVASVDYAQNSLYFTTARPVFRSLAAAGGAVSGNHAMQGVCPVSVTARFQAGSFNTYMPYLRADFRLTDRLSLSANAAGVFSKGNFPYGDGLVRANNDLQQVRAGLDLWGLFERGDFHVKAYYNDAKRGTPGAISWPSEDRQSDMNAFVQGTFRKSYSDLYTLRLSAKGSYDDIYYFSTWGDSRYGQTEVQLNTAHEFRIFDWWRFSLAADLQWDGLNSTAYQASRLFVFSALSSSFRTKKFYANVALEYAGAFDKDALSRNTFSPSVDLRFEAVEGLDLIAFSRRAYRVPTFSELYYVGYGNPELRPEDAWLNDVGLSFARAVGGEWRVNAKLDGFFNFLKDKIVSAPSELDPYLWLPYNIGRVRALGVDAVAGFDWHRDDWICGFNARYSWQSAVDVTPDSATYGNAVPYIAKHTVVLDARVSWKELELRPVWMMRGGRSDGYGELPSWNTLDVNLSKKFSLGKAGALSVLVAAKNVLDCRYELVSGYPMPGRSFLVGVEHEF